MLNSDYKGVYSEGDIIAFENSIIACKKKSEEISGFPFLLKLAIISILASIFIAFICYLAVIAYNCHIKKWD